MSNDVYDGKWLRQVIDEAIQQVLNENKVKEAHRALTADELRQYDIECFDFRKHQAYEIARALMYAFEKIKQQGDETSDFYCGITNDVVKRKEDHENKDYNGKKINIVLALKCADMKTAADTELIMHRRYGFSMGKTETYANGAAPDSDYVYIYRIPK